MTYLIGERRLSGRGEFHPIPCWLPAEQLVINPNTVARIYSQLIRDGMLEAQQGKGVFVATRRRTVYTKAERLRRIKDSLEAFVSQGVYLGFTPPGSHRIT